MLQAPGKAAPVPNQPEPLDPNPGVFVGGNQASFNIQNVTDEFHADFEAGALYEVTFTKVPKPS